MQGIMKDSGKECLCIYCIVIIICRSYKTASVEQNTKDSTVVNTREKQNRH